jgi:Spy/CpxP family protein refolding chaperone
MTPRSIRGLVISMLLLAFVAGVSAGVTGDRLLTPHVLVRARVGDMSSVLDRLRLTPAQRAQADAIVQRSTPRAEAIMIEVAERLRAVADSLDDELRAILTPDQRARLDSLRGDPRIMLKRRMVTPRGTTVDTILDTSLTRRPPR